MAYDTVVREWDYTEVHPEYNPSLEVRLPIKLVANTVYPPGAIVGEVTGSPGTYGLTITINKVSLTSNVATVTTNAPHGLKVGDSVAVTAVTATTINGTGLAVASVPTATSFTYPKTATNV